MFGLLNAILMPYVLKANQSAIDGQIVELCGYLNLNKSFDSFLQWILDLRSSLGIPHTLAEIGLDNKHASLVGQMAYKDATAGTNPVQLSEKLYEKLFIDALEGNG